MNRRRCSGVVITVLFLGGGLLLAEGCGKSGVERHNLSGQVTFRGKPLPAGLIVFEPDSRDGNEGPQGYATIVDGRYETSVSGKGVVAGALLVEICGFPPPDGSGGDPQIPLFVPYKTRVKVSEEITTLDFDVPARR